MQHFRIPRQAQSMIAHTILSITGVCIQILHRGMLLTCLIVLTQLLSPSQIDHLVVLAAPVVVDVHTTITVQVQSANTETTPLPPVVETDLTPCQRQQLPLVVSG